MSFLKPSLAKYERKLSSSSISAKLSPHLSPSATPSPSPSPSPGNSPLPSPGLPAQDEPSDIEDELPQLSDRDLPSPDYSFIGHALAPPALQQPLAAPIAIPQLTSSVQSKNFAPFARGYAPDLLPKGIREHEFLEFIDNLNIVFTPNEPLKILETTGSILGFSPEPISASIGQGLELSAYAAHKTLLKTGIKNFLKKANTELFNRRNLEVGICDTLELQKLLRLPKEGLGHADFSTTHPQDESTTQRRIAMLGGRVLPVDFDVPPPVKPAEGKLTPQQQFVAKVQEMSMVKKTSKSDVKKEEKHWKEWEKTHGAVMEHKEEIGRLEAEKASLEERKGQVGWRERKGVKKEIEGIEKEKARTEKKLDKTSGKSGKKGPQKALMKVMWVVVKNVE